MKPDFQDTDFAEINDDGDTENAPELWPSAAFYYAIAGIAAIVLALWAYALLPGATL